MTVQTVTILGAGPAGLTAGMYAARANRKPVIVSGANPGGQLVQTSDVENFPGFPDGISGFDLMNRMKQQAIRFGAEIVQAKALDLNLTPDGIQEIELSGGDTLRTRLLIAATGASPRWLNLESEQRLLGRGVSACATCDGAFLRSVPAAVVGGGDTACEEALYLTRFASEVHLIHWMNSLTASKIMAQRVTGHAKIHVHWNSRVEEVLGEDRVTGVRIVDSTSQAKQEIRCSGLFIALGYVPATELFRDKLNLTEHGCIAVDPVTLETSVSGVFAAGDCADSVCRQAITAAGAGCRAALAAISRLEKQEKE